MVQRRAVLIGVPEYKNGTTFSPLPVVRRDLDLLRESLEASGYTVNSHGITEQFESTRNTILSTLRRACREAKSGETLILYFSGHGLHFQWFLLYRLAFWRQKGLKIERSNEEIESLEENSRETLWSIEQSTNHWLLPEPEDDFIFTMSFQATPLTEHPDSPSSFLTSHTIQRNNFTAAQVVCLATYFQRPVEALLQRLNRFAPFGLAVPVIKQAILESVSLTREDLILLSENFDGKGHYINNISPEHLIWAAHKIGISAAEAWERLQRLSALGVQVFKIDSTRLTKKKVSDEDLSLLNSLSSVGSPISGKKSRIFDWEKAYRWWSNPMPAIYVAVTSAQRGQPVGLVYEQLRQFIPLGLQLPQQDLGSCQDLVPTSIDLVLLSKELDSAPAWVDGQVPEEHVKAAAAKLNQSIEDTLTQLRKFEVFGLILPKMIS